jgi:hypothetical protein
MYRIWWLWFAIGIIKEPLFNFTKNLEEGKYIWLANGRPL